MPSGGVTTVTAILNDMAMEFEISPENVFLDGSHVARPVFEAMAPAKAVDACSQLEHEIGKHAKGAKAWDVLLVRTDIPEVDQMMRQQEGASKREVVANDTLEELWVVDLWHLANLGAARAEGSRAAHRSLPVQTDISRAISASSASRSKRGPIG